MSGDISLKDLLAELHDADMGDGIYDYDDYSEDYDDYRADEQSRKAQEVERHVGWLKSKKGHLWSDDDCEDKWMDAAKHAYGLTEHKKLLLERKKHQLWEAQQTNPATKRHGGVAHDNDRLTKRYKKEVTDAVHAVAEAQRAELVTLREAVARTEHARTLQDATRAKRGREEDMLPVAQHDSHRRRR